jgi:5-methylcytosine-specific restriction endonuclease McrA
VSENAVKQRPDPEFWQLRWLWLFRDALYVTDRIPRHSELDEVVLRVKAIHFLSDESIKRLKEQVANFEAVELNTKSTNARRAIPDDVKILVWSRDGGACMKCGASRELQFDHVIPLAKGGSDTADNIQLLCRTCNLAKSDRLI